MLYSLLLSSINLVVRLLMRCFLQAALGAREAKDDFKKEVRK